VGIQAREALNFNISVALAELSLSYLVGTVPRQSPANTMLVLTLLAVLLGWACLTIFAATRASKGINYRYPLALRLVR
jgi:uncharacterized Tic20 family protein